MKKSKREGYQITFHKDLPYPGVRYLSSSTVYEEVLFHTRFIGLYWSATGYVQGENVIPWLLELNPLAYHLQAFELVIDGQQLHNRWEWVGASRREGKVKGTVEGVVELCHQVRPVKVRVITRLDGTPFLVRYLEITNTGKEPAGLSKVSPFSGMLWGTNTADLERFPTGLLKSSQSPFTLGYLDSTQQGTEGNFVWEPLPKGTRRIESIIGRSGFGGPYFILRNEVTGEYAFGALAWSGNWYLELWNDPDRNRENMPENGYRLIFKTGPSGPGPLVVLAPGERVVTPSVHLGLMHQEFDSCVQTFHHHLRTSVIPQRPRDKKICTVAGRVVEKPGAWIQREIEWAAKLGIEAFIVDANWYGRGEFSSDWCSYRGDWEEGGWISGGLDGCRERAHRHGMFFGLWMEPEVVGHRSQLTKEHPDWILKTDNGQEVIADLGFGRSGRLPLNTETAPRMLSLANPEAAKFVSQKVREVIKRYRLDFFKLDYNFNPYEGGQRERDGYLENETWRHYQNLYQIFDRVRKDFPNLHLENCSSGGGRNDLGMMSRFHCAAISDFSTFPRSIREINGITIFLPPEALCYYHVHLFSAHQMADIDTHLRVILFCQPVFVGFGAQNTPHFSQYLQKVKRYIKLFQEIAAPILAKHPKVFHHTPDIGLYKPATWCVLEYATEDGSAGYAGIFRLRRDGGGQKNRRVSSNGEEYLFKPKGINPAEEYLITLDNSGAILKMAGIELLRWGIPIRLSQVCTSELIIFRKAPFQKR